jgi:hypothetical protein
MSVLGRRLRTVGTAAAACALLVLSSGCGDDGEAADDGTTTSTSDTTIASTTTTQDPEAEVEAAYLAYWEMAERLVENPNPDDPEIVQRSSGTARATLIDSLTTLRAQAHSVRSRDRTSHEVLVAEVQGDTAVVRDCNVDDAVRIEISTGREVQSGITTNLLEASLASNAGSWTVASIEKLGGWEGAQKC